ncbi:hypothetical protein [Rhizobium mesosinicum]|uniref:Uncharacterized protein n=1 Tax=Rhizobium mesosinicum TaxID=335017 RepID=A0ABS7GZZ2_9HYPH|nr:hypothetical protein [Rhizobium mesosinicum]MBW9054684.1 hypothetical protein [Rhizobium mesosinicum]
MDNFSAPLEIFENFLDALNYGACRILQTPGSLEVEGLRIFKPYGGYHERLLHSRIRFASQAVAPASGPCHFAKHDRALALAHPYPQRAEAKVEDQIHSD